VIELSTFGRDGAMFESLLAFVAQLSIALWSLVLLTAVIRSVGIRIYRRGAARRRLIEAEAHTTAVPALDLAHAPGAVRAPGERLAEPRPATPVPALADSLEA